MSSNADHRLIQKLDTLDQRNQIEALRIRCALVQSGAWSPPTYKVLVLDPIQAKLITHGIQTIVNAPFTFTDAFGAQSTCEWVWIMCEQTVINRLHTVDVLRQVSSETYYSSEYAKSAKAAMANYRSWTMPNFIMHLNTCRGSIQYLVQVCKNRLELPTYTFSTDWVNKPFRNRALWYVNKVHPVVLPVLGHVGHYHQRPTWPTVCKSLDPKIQRQHLQHLKLFLSMQVPVCISSCLPVLISWSLTSKIL